MIPKKLSKIVMFFEEIFHPGQIVYSIIDVGKIIFLVFFIAHMVSCFIYYISKSQSGYDETWITKLDYSTWIEYYVTGFYFAVVSMITIGYGDVVPITINEKLFVMFMSMVSCGVFAYSLNTISTIISEFSKRRSLLRKKMIHLNINIENRGLNKQTAIKVRKYLKYIYKENEENLESSEQDLKLIPQSLKDEDIYGKLLRSNKIFKENFSDKLINKLSLLMKEKKFGPEEYIYRPYDKGSKIFFILKGTVDIYLPVKNPSQNEYPVLQTLKKGDSFGVYSFFSGQARESGAISKQVTSVVILDIKDFKSVIQHNQEDYEIYCMMKDKINLNNSAYCLDVKCKSCGKSNHQIKECPLIKYKPMKQLVIARSNLTQPQVRKKWKRRTLRSPNSLFIWEYIRDIDSEVFSNFSFQSLNTMSLLDEFVQQKKLSKSSSIISNASSSSSRSSEKFTLNQLQSQQFHDQENQENNLQPFEHFEQNQPSNILQQNIDKDYRLDFNQKSNDEMIPYSKAEINIPKENKVTFNDDVNYCQTPENLSSFALKLSKRISSQKAKKNSIKDESSKNNQNKKKSDQLNVFGVNQQGESQNLGLASSNRFSPYRKKKNTSKDEDQIPIQNQKNHVSQKQIEMDKWNQEMEQIYENKELAAKKRQQQRQKSYFDTIQRYNSQFNQTHCLQDMNSNFYLNNPNSLIKFYDQSQTNINAFPAHQHLIQDDNQLLMFSSLPPLQQSQILPSPNCRPRSLVLEPIVEEKNKDQNKLNEILFKNEYDYIPPFLKINDFDKAKSYARYQTHNNIENVLGRIKYLIQKRNKSILMNNKQQQNQPQREKISLTQVVQNAQKQRKQRKQLSLLQQNQFNSDAQQRDANKHKKRSSLQSNLSESNLDLQKLKNFQKSLTNINLKNESRDKQQQHKSNQHQKENK